MQITNKYIKIALAFLVLTSIAFLAVIVTTVLVKLISFISTLGGLNQFEIIFMLVFFIIMREFIKFPLFISSKRYIVDNILVKL